MVTTSIVAASPFPAPPAGWTLNPPAFQPGRMRLTRRAARPRDASQGRRGRPPIDTPGADRCIPGRTPPSPGRASQLARAEGTTLKSVREEGLRAVIARHRSATQFPLRVPSVDGNRVPPEFAEASWAQ